MPILSRGRGGVIATPPSSGGREGIVLRRPRYPAGSVAPLLSSLSEEGETQLTGDITFSAGTGITLTQTGQDIEIAVA